MSINPVRMVDNPFYVPEYTINNPAMSVSQALGYPSVKPVPVENYYTMPQTNELSVGQKMLNGIKQVGQNVYSDFNKLPLSQKGATILNGIGSIMGAYNAYKTNKIAQDQLNFQKDQYYRNYENQKRMTNSQLEDRQRVRMNASPSTNLSVSEYMNRYGVK